MRIADRVEFVRVIHESAAVSALREHPNQQRVEVVAVHDVGFFRQPVQVFAKGCGSRRELNAQYRQNMLDAAGQPRANRAEERAEPRGRMGSIRALHRAAQCAAQALARDDCRSEEQNKWGERYRLQPMAARSLAARNMQGR